MAHSDHHVDIYYREEPVMDYLREAVATVMSIHLYGSKGDVLLFLDGQEEVVTACQTFYEGLQQSARSPGPELIILQVHSALGSELPFPIFETRHTGTRMVVVCSTNTEQACFGIDGIRYVVDSGFSKHYSSDPLPQFDSFVSVPISQGVANVRSIMAGRTGPSGICYRLYTESSYRSRPKICPSDQWIWFPPLSQNILTPMGIEKGKEIMIVPLEVRKGKEKMTIPTEEEEEVQKEIIMYEGETSTPKKRKLDGQLKRNMEDESDQEEGNAKVHKKNLEENAEVHKENLSSKEE